MRQRALVLASVLLLAACGGNGSNDASTESAGQPTTEPAPAPPPAPKPPEPRHLDPWTTAELLARTRDDVLAQITHDVETSLRDLRPLDKTYQHPDTPLVTTVELDDVARASALGPSRFGAFSYPGFGGYSPAGVFKTVVARALKKASKRQTEGVASETRALVVYLMGAKIADDLVHPVHMKEAEAALEEVDPQRYGLDVIAFVARVQPRGLAAIFTVADDTTLSIAEVESLFAQRRESND